VNDPIAEAIDEQAALIPPGNIKGKITRGRKVSPLQAAVEGEIISRLTDKGKLRKRPMYNVKLTPNEMRGAIRQGSKAELRARLKGTGRSLVSVAAEQAQKSREEAKRITAEQKAERAKRREETSRV
jgi:hypothetical protein